MKEFAVSADLDISAQSYFLEKDSVAFRCLMAQVPKPCMHRACMHKARRHKMSFSTVILCQGVIKFAASAGSRSRIRRV